MIVVAIIGILSSLAISAYQTYTIRAQVTEGLSMAAGAKAPVTDAYLQSGTAPADRVAAGMSADPADTSGNYVSGVLITNGRVEITFGGPRAHQDINGDTLFVTPYLTSNNSIAWRCGKAGVPGGSGTLMDGGEDHGDGGTIIERYLPSTCRR